MGMNAATMRLLKEKGLSLDDILEVADALERKADRTNAERQARYRAKRKRNAVTVTDVSPPIEEIIPPISSGEEIIPAPKNKRKAAVVVAEKPEGVTDRVWRDFTGQRKTPVTETALDGICQEAEKAGWTLNAALTEAVSRGWQSFKADWVGSARAPPSEPVSLVDRILAKQAASP
jgi:hypothetical protein